MLFDENPFFKLGVSPSSDKEEISDAAETYEMMNDDASAKEMVLCLTNPIKRIEAELAWFHSEFSEDIAEMLEWINNSASFDECMEKLVQVFKQRDELDFFYVGEYIPEDSLTIYYGNVVINAIERHAKDNKCVKKAILNVALAYDLTKEEELMDYLNELREMAEIPLINDINKLRNAMLERKNFFVKFFLGKLQRMNSREMIKIFTELIEETTNNGELCSYAVIYGLIDEYEKNTLRYFEKNTPKIEGMISKILDAAKSGVKDDVLKELVSKLIAATKQWDFVAQPIQVAAQSKGMEHAASVKLGYELRELAVTLWNEYEKLDLSIMLTNAISEIFKEVFSLKEKTGDDKAFLDNLMGKYNDSKEIDAFMNYHGESGRIMKDKFTITPDSFTYSGTIKKVTIPLDSIQHLAWGTIIKGYVGGPKTSKHYLSIMYNGKKFNVNLSNDDVFVNIVQRIGVNPGNRLVADMLDRLRNGETLTCGSMKFDDWGIWFHSFSGYQTTDEHFPLSDLAVGRGDGLLRIEHKTESLLSFASYIDNWDTHLIDYIFSAAIEKKCRRLSELGS